MPDGHLPDALRAAAVEVINERGLGGFSLREVTRRAGVSHAAPAYHFHNAKGLLTSLAVEGFVKLREALVEAGDGIDDPAERLVAMGCAYVATGVAFPAHCAVAFRADLLDVDDPELKEVGPAAYAVLEEAVRAMAERYNPVLPVQDAANLCWSAMQGLLVLYPNISLACSMVERPVESIEALAERFARLLADGLKVGRVAQPFT